MNPERVISDVLEKTSGSIRYQRMWNGEKILVLIPRHIKNDIHYHELFFNEITVSYVPVNKRLTKWFKEHGDSNPYIIGNIGGIEEGIMIMKERFISRINEGYFDKDLEDMKQFMESVHESRFE